MPVSSIWNSISHILERLNYAQIGCQYGYQYRRGRHLITLYLNFIKLNNEIEFNINYLRDGEW